MECPCSSTSGLASSNSCSFSAYTCVTVKIFCTTFQTVQTNS
jgi:hypothetical protein